jgi:hypothetical protein
MKIWEKLGHVYTANYIDKSLVSHASNPLAIPVGGDVFRVFFSGRDAENRSSVGWVDIDVVKGSTVERCSEAVFKVTKNSDSFYSHGVSIGNRYESNGSQVILFMAWQIPKNEHWRGDIGRLQLGPDQKSLQLVDDGPFMSVDNEDPISLSYPWVMVEDGLFKMWYGSTVSWNASNGEMIHVIKYATSTDGLNWDKKGTAIPWALGEAQAFSRPTVIKNADGYHMWFSYRRGGGDKYKIGYASSLDGLDWVRALDSGLTASDQGWDSEMVCYPYVFKHKGRIYMFYNGNDHGRNGFGLAVFRG